MALDLRDELGDIVQFNSGSIADVGSAFYFGGNFYFAPRCIRRGESRTWRNAMYSRIASDPVEIELTETLVKVTAAEFRRGDANLDGKVDISHSLAILGYLFLGAAEPGCLDAADVDDNGKIEITDGDLVSVLLFLGGTAPIRPGPFGCGIDGFVDDSGCRQSCEA